MGTKLQYARNPLVLSPTPSFSAYQLNDWHSLRKNIELRENSHPPHCYNKSWSSINRMLEPHQVEFIKATMLKQESIFQNQVRELHRLYSIQRMLMNEPKNDIRKAKFWGSKDGFFTKDQGFVNIEDKSRKDTDRGFGEPSGSCSGEMHKGFDLERPAVHEEDMSTGVSAIDESQTGPSNRVPRRIFGANTDENCTNVELTLSIGGGSIGKNRSQSHKENSDNTPVASSSASCSEKTLHGFLKI